MRMKKKASCVIGAALLSLLPVEVLAHNGSEPDLLVREEVQAAIGSSIALRIHNGLDNRLLFIAVGICMIGLGGILYWNRRIRHLRARLSERQAELAQLGEKLEENEMLYYSVLNTSLDGIMLLDRDGTILMASPAARGMVGAGAEEPILGKKLADFIDETDHDNLKNNFEELVQGISGGIRHYTGRTRNSGPMALEVNSELVCDGRRQAVRIVSIVRDITEQQRTEKELKLREARCRDQAAELKAKNEILRKTEAIDSLTGLRNRHYFEQKMSEEITFAAHQNSGLALILFDLDHLKSINDRYGHDAGDSALVRIAAAVGRLIRKSDLLARWGGGEFAVMMPLVNLEEAQAVAEKLRAAIAEMEQPGIEPITVSMGISLWRETETAAEWYSRTDKALYKAKSQGRNRVALSDGQDAMSINIVSWSKDWECGNEKIDQQHYQLLLMGNDLLLVTIDHNRREQMFDLIQKLIDHITMHFKDEEVILSEYGYSDLEQHRGVHFKLLNQAHMILDQLCRGAYHPDEVVRFIIGDIITGHLLGDDVKFFHLF